MLKPLFLAIILFLTIQSDAQVNANWTQKQLMEPSELAGIITNHKDSIVLISIGPFKSIPGTIAVGMTTEQPALDKFKATLSVVKIDQKIVIYCGCCPFEKCPNVRPAIDVLKELNFTNYYLLNLSTNLRINWIDKGYPMVQQ